ncbi:YL1 nuclear protein-domain-containing protein, partial [Amylocarpus encephaloides]
MASNLPEDTPTRTEVDNEDGSSDSDSGSGSESGEQEQEVEWLATSRQRRSTAGNRLNSLLQAEEPDDDLELLFAEAEDDEVFDVEDADSDVQMDSSDDDDDQGPAAGADDLEGEKELQNQAKAELKAKRRKLNDGIPKIYKKVKIDPTAAQAHTQASRPKKKSERASWIPTAEDAPTRSSARGTTQKSKQELLLQMQDREIKRLKQLKHMEKAAAAKEAAKKPPMTQGDRLREAAKVEKSNKKSLSRWEEMEQQREEEQRERLAALQNRTLEGPVITWWSGKAEWVGGKLKKVGLLIVRDEPKEKAGRKRKVAEMEEEPSKIADASKCTSISDPRAVLASTTSANDKIPDQKEGKGLIDRPPSSKTPPTNLDPTIRTPSPSNIPLTQPRSPPLRTPTPSPTKQTPPPNSSLQPPQEHPLPPPPPPLPPPPRPSSCLAPPPMHGPYPPPPDQNGHRKSSVLAPPPMHGPIPPPYSHLASNPHPTQGQNPFQPPFKLAPPMQLHFDGSAPLPGFGYNFIAPNQTPYPGTIQAPPHAPPPFPALPAPENKTPPPPAREHTAINYLILNNFDNDAIKDKDIQTQILFKRKFQKIPLLTNYQTGTKPSHSLCAITSYPAKYRDPCTGLEYNSVYAYKEIQRLKRAEYKWSNLVGCYVGSGTYVARGVPARFLNG